MDTYLGGRSKVPSHWVRLELGVAGITGAPVPVCGWHHRRAGARVAAAGSGTRAGMHAKKKAAQQKNGCRDRDSNPGWY